MIVYLAYSQVDAVFILLLWDFSDLLSDKGCCYSYNGEKRSTILKIRDHDQVMDKNANRFIKINLGCQIIDDNMLIIKMSIRVNFSFGPHSGCDSIHHFPRSSVKPKY